MRRILILLAIVGAVFFVIHNHSLHIFPKKTFTTQLRLPIALPNFPKLPENTWSIQSIDTMKYSRDVARLKAKDLAFLGVINGQMKNIVNTGANYVAIDTPYDQEFFPMLQKWVAVARKYNLHVWFRGNWSGWEGWFNYPKNLSRQEHIQKSKNFILRHPDIFSDGDIFSSCPECENGGPGDPRHTGDITGFRNFMVSEYKIEKDAFKKIGKKVSANYYPMNRDVAKIVMDKSTTAAMGGIVVVDHYIKSPQQYAIDLKNLQHLTGGKIVLGEFGAPIPDIHGKMTKGQQAQWIDDVLNNLSGVDGIEGVNYWVNAGGTTSIWDAKGGASAAVSVLEKYFKAKNSYGIVTDEMNRPIGGAKISFQDKNVFSQDNGYFEIRFIENFPINVVVSAAGFSNKNFEIKGNNKQLQLILQQKKLQ